MKKLYTLSLVLFVGTMFAQIPAGYYNTATGTGYTLKTQLFKIIGTHTDITYAGLWDLYPTSDKKADGTVWDIYSNCPFTFGKSGNQDQGTGGTSECQFYNREHTFPKNWFSSATPMYTDAFHIMPTDKKDNGLRGNYSYGIVGTATYTTSNGSKIGNNVAPNGSKLTVFEPADEYKGDIARNYFYMATCYEDKIAGWEKNDANGDAFLDGTNTKVFEQWSLDMLYSWHIADPVSQKEIDRNNAIYAVQKNRNPYIDHPEYVQAVWGTSLSAPQFEVFSQVAVFPNPSNDHRINIQSEQVLDEIVLININGQIIQQIKKPAANGSTYTLSNIPQGFYLLKLNANNQSTTKKIIVN